MTRWSTLTIIRKEGVRPARFRVHPPDGKHDRAELARSEEDVPALGATAMVFREEKSDELSTEECTAWGWVETQW